MVTMCQWSRVLLTLGVSFFLASCSGGGGTGDTAPPPAASTGFTQTYTSTAAAGEILTYTIDTQNLTYSYRIVYSAYGLTNATGSGTLESNPDGSFSPKDAPSTKVYALENGLLIGTVNLTLNNVIRTVPIVGIAHPVSSLTALAGTYTYVGLLCASQTFGVYTGCTSAYGTIQADSAGNYTTCHSANIANGVSACTESSTGTVTLLGDGVWKAVRSGSTNTNYMIAFTAPNGQNVLLLDINDPGGSGYGLVILSTQAAYVESLVDGTWFYQSNAGTAGSLAVAGSNVTLSQGGSLILRFDFPWTGLNSVSDGGLSLLAGTGAYAYINNSSQGFLEVGMKK